MKNTWFSPRSAVRSRRIWSSWEQEVSEFRNQTEEKEKIIVSVTLTHKEVLQKGAGKGTFEREGTLRKELGQELEMEL